jgi:hypothetical protein
MKGPAYVTGTHAGCRSIFHLFIQFAGQIGYTNSRIFAGKVKGQERPECTFINLQFTLDNYR